jgi:outer membrane biosynthesis protein TonB
MQQANKNEVRKEIAALIDQIKRQSDRIGVQRDIPQQELDVILHRIEELHRKTVVWSYLNTLPEAPEVKQEVVVPSETVQIQEPEAIKPVPAEEVKQPAPEVKPMDEVKPVVENTPEPVVQLEPEPAKPEPATKELKDIRGFIGFNEKLMYIRQCFSGNADAYAQAIDKLNAATTESEAQTILAAASKEHNWNKDNEAVQIFFQTVKRRFN